MTMRTGVAAVVLAAGASTRMREHKLLLPLGGEAVVRRTVRQICDAGFDDVLVILGRDAEAVRAALDGLPCRFAINAEFETGGMGSSFRVAVTHLGECEAAMFALADQPFVTAVQYRLVRDAFLSRASHGEGGPASPSGRSHIVSVRYGEVVAPPQLFARELFPELTRLEEGARPVLKRHADRIVILEFPVDQLIDIDTPDDYARAQAQAQALASSAPLARSSTPSTDSGA